MTTILSEIERPSPNTESLRNGVDFSTADFIDNPYPYYAHLRAHRPVAPVVGMNAVFLTRYEDVKAAGFDDRFRIDFKQLQTNRMGLGVTAEPFFRFGREFMAFSDPPQHAPLKNLFMQVFTRQRADQYLPKMRAIVNAVVEEFVQDGEAELVGQFANEAPLRIISSLLGIDRTEQAELDRWIQAYTPVIGFPPMTPAQTEQANQASYAFESFFRSRLDKLRTARGDDLISEILTLNAHEEYRLDEFAIVANLILLYFAGQDTQKGHMGNILVALHDAPDQLAWLKEDPARIWRCVNELTRFDSVSQITGRVAAEDIPLHGEVIRKGQTALLGIGASNRDPEVFSDPDRLDLQRPEAKFTITFGVGRHACLGAHFARQSIPLMIETLLTRLPALEIDMATLQRSRTLSKRGYSCISARWSAA